MAVETYGGSPEVGMDVFEAQRLLGYAVTPLLGPGMSDPQIPYDERLTICEVALAAKESMRAALGVAAEATGMAVAAEDLQAWEPDEQQLAAIRKSLSRERKRARMLDGFSQFIDDGRLEENAFGPPLWPNQQDMCGDTEVFMATMARTYDKGGKGGVISGPPGSGKTGVISTLCAALKYNEDPSEPVRIIIIENTQNVMHQTHGQDGERGFGRFAPHLDVGLRYQRLKDLDHDIVIMPVASFNLLMERGEMPDCDFVIGDEGDIYSAGQTGGRLHEYVRDKMLVLVTATPDEATYDLAPHDIYTMNLPEGIHDSLLAPTTGLVRKVPFELNEAALPSDPRERKKAIRAAYLRAWIEDAKPLIKEAVENGTGALIHCRPGGDIEVAQMLAGELREIEVTVPNPMDGTWPERFKTIRRPMRAIHVGGTKQRNVSGKRFQQTVFRHYNQSQIDALVFVKAIGRGDDFPNAKLLIDLEPQSVRSWRTVVQLGGRVTRLVRDERGKPLPATWICYYDPFMEDQYTSVMALGGDKGQDEIRVGHERNVRMLPPAQLRSRLVADRVIGQTVVGETIDRIDVRNMMPEEVSVVEPELPAMNAHEIAAYLLVSEVTIKQIYKDQGMSPDDVLDSEGIELLLEYYPHLRPAPLPGPDYTIARVLVEQLGRGGIRTVRRLRLLAGQHGIEFRRYVAPGALPDFYVTDEEAGRLRDLLGDPAQ